MSKNKRKEKFKREISSNLIDLEEERRELQTGDKEGKSDKKEFLGQYTLEQKQKFVNRITVIGLIISLIIVVILYLKGYLTNRDKLVEAISNLGLFAPISFFIIQIVQVVIPIIPGGVTSVVGVVIFGPFWGFILNHLGILIGSCINFYLGRIYGTAFLKIFLNEKTYSKYNKWVQGNNKFPLFFGVTMFLPGMPDDIICILAGITRMSFKQFFIIYNFTKPFGLIGYSMFFAYFPEILEKLSGFFN